MWWIRFEDTIWAFVFGSRNGHIWALSLLSPCTHNSDCSYYNHRAIFFPEWPLIFLVITIHQVIWPSPGTLPGTRVPELPIRDCKRSCNNRAQMRAQLSAIDVTAKTFFERLYLVLGLCKIELCVSCPCALTTPTIHYYTISRFLCNFFPEWPLIFFVHDSPSNLAESRYPPRYPPWERTGL